jgi:mannose-1-phosphate guanylyltransferase/phosphomannomutase
MKAIVMAGGQGSRLRPLTINRPKPLLPLVNKPIIAHIIDWLKRNGIYEIVITLQHQAEWFQNYLLNSGSLGVSIEYQIEDVPLGTAGGVALAYASGHIAADETVIVVSGDAATDIALKPLIEFHRQRGAEVTVALYRSSNPLEYGMVITEPDGRIAQFIEKPGWAEVVSDLVNTGIYVLEGRILAEVPKNEPYDFSRDLFPRLLAAQRPIYGRPVGGYWCDIGTPAAYLQANADVLRHRMQHEPLGKPLADDIWVGEHVVIAPDAQVIGPVYLGNHVQIKSGAVIQGPAVIRDDTVIDRHAQISRTVMWRGCYVGEGAQIHGALVSRQCVFKARSVVQEGVVIGDRCVIGEDAMLFTNVKLWPGKEIDPGALVRESIVWGTRGRRVLFSRFGVSGVVNVDLTPEFAAKLGVAFGSILPKGSIVTINRDPHPSSRMLKRAIISGLPAAGVRVWDLRTQPMPVARFLTRFSEAVAGVHVRISPFDRRVVDIRFIGADGLNLDRATEREIEWLFFREDFRRVQSDDIGAIDYVADVEQRYSQAFLQALDRDRIRQARLTIAVDYAHATTVDVLEPLLGHLGVEVVGLNERPDPNLLALSPHEWDLGMERLGKIVQAMGLNLGARLDVSGSQIFFVDDKGRALDTLLAAAAMADLVWREQPYAIIAATIDMPAIFDHLAARYGGSLVRTKVDTQALMTVANERQAALAIDGSGHFIFPALHPVPDGLFALARLLQSLAHQQVTLSEVVDALPRFVWLHETVPCLWEAKGRVMRQANERAELLTASTLDGVKLFFDANHWALIRPDPDRALLHVVVEAQTPAEAAELMTEQKQWLQSLIENA